MRPAALLCLAALVAACSPGCSAGTTSRAFTRAAASGDLPLDAGVLVRKHASPLVPEQVHTAFAGPGALAISWVTGQATEDHEAQAGKKHDPLSCQHIEQAAGSVVLYGTKPGSYPFNATGRYACYVADNYASGQLHHVVLGAGAEGPLAPRTTFYYIVGDPELGMSAEYSVTTAPALGAASLPYRLGLIGDLGQTRNSQETLQHVLASAPESVLNVGDLSYADGYQPRWDAWGRLVEPSFASTPWMVIEGNHEEELANGEKGFLAYETRFTFPSQASKSGSPFYYSYEVAGAHIVMLGCYVEYARDSDQFAWLQADLASVDRQRTPWLLVGMHAPWYNSNEAHQGEMDDMLEAMEELLFQFGVDAVFAGHVHAYERAGRTYRGEPHVCGPVYIVIGDGGNREGLAREYLEPQPAWSVFREASYGHGVLDLLNATHAVWRWHRNQDAAAVVSDEVVLERTSKCAGMPSATGATVARRPHGGALSSS